MYYDLKANKFVDEKLTGIIGSISFRRLAQELRTSGEVTSREAITAFEVSGDVLRFRIEIKP